MIRDYLVLLSWLCAVQGKIGKCMRVQTSVSVVLTPILRLHCYTRYFLLHRTLCLACSDDDNDDGELLKRAKVSALQKLGRCSLSAIETEFI